MAGKRRKFTREFKLNAVKLVLDGRTVTEVAESLDLDRGLLQTWKKKFVEDGSVAFPGHGNRKPEDEELRRLRKQLADAQQERDILKKALAYFAKDKK